MIFTDEIHQIVPIYQEAYMQQFFVRMAPVLMGSREVIDTLVTMTQVSMVLEAPPYIFVIVEAENLDDAHDVLSHINNIENPLITKISYAHIAMRCNHAALMQELAEVTEPILIDKLEGVAPPVPKLKVATPIITEVPDMPATNEGRVYRYISSQAGLSALGALFIGTIGEGLNDQEELSESHLSNPTRITEW